MLQAADVVFGYAGAPVLRGVSLRVGAGDTVGVIGPNGSGKTTMLRILAGTRQPSDGTVSLDGRPIRSFTRQELARRIAVVPQDTHLAFDFTVLEVVLMGRYPHLGAFQVEGPRDLEIARAALAAAGGAAIADRAFSTLSGGEKQRVVVAAALAQITRESAAPPPILLLDEPTAALDLRYQLALADLLRTLHRERLLTLVISTHDLGFAASLCSTLVMLKEGRVLAAGPVDEVLTPSRIRELYDVDAEVARHPRTGRLTVVPLGTAVGGP